MPRSYNTMLNTDSRVGVGLRHEHYQDASLGTSSVDFVEVHAENFFSEGGLSRAYLEKVSEVFPISLHATSLGLGSAHEINQDYLQRLKTLVDDINPWMISDHACFTWSTAPGNKTPVHAGDLLPIEFSQHSLEVLSANVDRVQQKLGRRILVENISSYIAPDYSLIKETDFLLSLVDRTQCGLLVDLNNLLVNAYNFSSGEPLFEAIDWLEQIPGKVIGEFHLAGSTPVSPSQLLIDDHGDNVSDECWTLYECAIDRFGPKPTLIERDNNLPPWEELVHEAETARHILTTLTPAFRG